MKKFVKPAEKISLGEKNGKKTGIMFFTVVKGVEGTNNAFFNYLILEKLVPHHKLSILCLPSLNHRFLD